MNRRKFNFTSREKVGLIGLSILAIGLISATELIESNKMVSPFDLDTTQIDWYAVQETEVLETENVDWNESVTNKEKSEDYFNFDPNTIDLDGLQQLNFTEKQGLSIIKYRESFGPFKAKEDFKKPYVVSDKKYAELETYIQIDEVENSKLLIELNSADVEALRQVSGIGEKRANTILKYRKVLGGYAEIDQLDEVYGLPPDVVEKLGQAVYIEQDSYELIKINSVEKSRLEEHPYFDFKMIALIMKERDRRKIESVDFLIEDCSQEKVDIIKPYISFE